MNHASAIRPLVLDPITGVTATSTSSTIEGNPGFTVSNNSLVSGASNVLGASDSLGDSGFNSDDASDFGNFVFSVSGGNITYNLGGAYNVTNLLIWNFSQQGFSFVGANEVDILTSTDGVVFTPVVGPNTDGSFTFDEADGSQYNSPRPIAGNNPPHPVGGTATEPAQILGVDLSDVQYVEIVTLSNRFDPTNQGEVNTGAGGLVGINEINFVGEAVPEPSTWAMLGFGLLGLIAWQRRRAV